MDPRKYSFPVVTLDGDGKPEHLCGNAFPVSTDGDLVTCRHVVEGRPEGTQLAVIDREDGLRICTLERISLADDPNLDIALLPGVLDRACHAFPLLPEEQLSVGHDVHTYGFYSQSGRVDGLSDGMFKGHVVRFQTTSYALATVSFPIIEGLSGSPLLMYHNGVKVVGVCCGVEAQRVLASEVLDYRDGDTEIRETINRIVEFGVALRVSALRELLARTDGPEPILTDQRYDEDELG